MTSVRSYEVERSAESDAMVAEEHESLGRIVRLAKRLIGAETAMISLTGHESLRFIGNVGLGEDLEDEGRHDVSDSFCRYAVATGERFVVPDARASGLLRHSRGLIERGVIAYAGTPLRPGDGPVLGTLCVMEPRPRSWTDEDLENLEELAGLACTELSHRPSIRDVDLVERLALRLPEPMDRLADAVRATAVLADDPQDPRLPRTADVARDRLRAVETLADDLARAALVQRHDRRREPEQVAFQERLARALQVVTPSCGERRLVVEMPPDPLWISWVPTELDRALSMTLVSALHYAADADPVRVAVRGEGGRARLSVSSPGPAPPIVELLRLVGSYQSAAANAGSINVRSAAGVTRVRGQFAEVYATSGETTTQIVLPLVSFARSAAVG